MSASKSVSKVTSVINVSHGKKVSKMKKSKSSTPDTIVHVTSAPSPEVSASPPTLAPLATSAPALAPAVVAAPPVTPPGDLPPAVGAPAPPKEWVPAPGKRRGGKGSRPRGAQITSAVAAAKELTQSASYVADFGSRAPAAPQVAFVVTNAAKWRNVAAISWPSGATPAPAVTMSREGQNGLVFHAGERELRINWDSSKP